MATTDPRGQASSDPVSLDKQDEILERAVLTEVLVLHPAALAILELALRMDASCEDFARKDAVERAVRELTRDGLIHCDCRRIWPTRAAIRFNDLLRGAS
jgi:hypothetical protein